jgi:predicted DNA-binding protein (MmcQ/YjbR family)
VSKGACRWQSPWRRGRASVPTRCGCPKPTKDSPWGDRVVKVRKKIFVFLGEGAAGSTVGMKLGPSFAAVASMPGVAPMRYELGKAGWVTIPLRGGPPPELLLEWITESYVLVAPKRLAASIPR